ncbi:DUF4097 family beta strand repeat-containing protein [Brevibacillus sp. SYSU BS000544]|uniref:DUF4097 family beta strand repeat-containing protein n=1 Tax=Brevibacillus sp. SYSU BS000544 TaxID=3416443 RepID=UPI003CE4BE22
MDSLPAVDVSEERVLNGKEIDQIQVKTEVASIKISESSDEQIHVLLDGTMDEKSKEKYRFSVESHGNQAEIKFDMSENNKFGFSFFENNPFDTELIISLPEKTFNKIDIHSDVGKIEMETIRAEELVVGTNVGNIALEEYIGKQAELKTDIGSIEINNAIGKMNIETNTGKVYLGMDKIDEDINIKSDTGKVEVVVENKPDSLALDLKSEIGKVTADTEGISIEEQMDSEIVGRLGSGGPKVKVRTDVGSIEFITQ